MAEAEKIKIKTVERRIGDLIPYDQNPRILSPKEHKDLTESILKFGLYELPAINTDNTIVAGHQRITIYKELHGDNDIIECRMPEKELSNEDFREYLIRSNKNNADWDWDILKNEYEQEQLIEWGFEAGDFDFDDGEDPTVIPDEPPEPPKEPKTELGRIYQLGKHRLMCGDSTSEDDVKRLMDGEKADMVFTDPPYNVSFNGRSGDFDVIKNDNLSTDDFNGFIDDFCTILKWLEVPIYYVWCNWKFYGVLQDRLDYKACIVWAKNVFGLGRGYRHQHEFCLFNGSLDEGINNESDLWEIARDTNYMHPTQKPIALAVRAIKNHKLALTVLDLFGGSGSTLIACEQTNRECRMMELDPKYCDVIVQRYCNLKGIDSEKVFETLVAE